MIASRPSSQNWVPFSAKIKCWVSSYQFNIWCKITHEIENGTSKRLELLRVKHLDQSLWWANDKTLSTSQIILIILFCTCALLLCTANCAIMLNQNFFPDPNWHNLTFLHPILSCRITYWAWLKIVWICDHVFILIIN
jgi:hypothetical protein